MYELHESFTPYYAEIDPKKRLAVLDSLPESEESDFLRRLYNDRYSDHENKGRKNVDWWLWRCICLQQLCDRGGFFRRFRNREVAKIIDELHMTASDSKNFYYHEYRNVARRYLSTCRSGNYASRFMGFRQASDDEKILRACFDIWQMSRGIARAAGAEDAMKLWCEAFRDELIDYDSVCREEYERLDSQQ